MTIRRFYLARGIDANPTQVQTKPGEFGELRRKGWRGGGSRERFVAWVLDVTFGTRLRRKGRGAFDVDHAEWELQKPEWNCKDQTEGPELSEERRKNGKDEMQGNPILVFDSFFSHRGCLVSSKLDACNGFSEFFFSVPGMYPYVRDSLILAGRLPN